MISNFKLFPNFYISQNFVQNVRKQKNTFVLSCKSGVLYLPNEIRNVLHADGKNPKTQKNYSAVDLICPLPHKFSLE